MSDLTFTIAAGFLGLLIGGFLNVCVVRLGAEPKESVIRPGPRCLKCGKPLLWYDNLPVISWILLRGRCRHCEERIGLMYPAIEIAVAFLWAGSVAVYGPGLTALKLACAATLLLGIAVTDARGHIIPHELSIGGTILAVMLAAMSNFTGALIALQGALFGAGLVLLFSEVSEMLLGQEAIGGGDCALMGMVGAFFGWEAVLPVLGLGALLSLILYIPLLLASTKDRRESANPVENETPVGLRWGRMLKLLVIGVLGLGFLWAAMFEGILGVVLRMLSFAILGSGLAYYAGFLIPEASVRGRWPKVRGILGAAVGCVVGVPTWIGVMTGAAIAAASLWYAGHAEVSLSPNTLEEQRDHGYVPYGVGLAGAAGLLAFIGGYNQIREMFQGIAPLLGLL